MWCFLPLSLLATFPAVWASSTHAKRDEAPTVTISYPEATIIGSSFQQVETFNAIPFAQQPTGSLRLKPPQPLKTSLGTVHATGAAKSCPQFQFSTDTSAHPQSILGEIANLPIFQTISNSGEDCLNLNVWRPSGIKPGDNLPVIVWILGGGFEMGTTATYKGSNIVSASMSLDMPIVFVEMNYRLGGFGFMPGSEIRKDGAANLGLQDQRRALEWVADNIETFGGDPSKVTIWGVSAGSISVFDQMAMYDGNHTYKGAPLFKGAIMDSGTITPTDPVDGIKGQAVYDTVVKSAGCSKVSDTLECLRSLDYTAFLNAANSVPNILSYTSVALSYMPRPDGVILTDTPEKLVSEGKYAAVPFITGDQEDEGTIFALLQSNITTTADIVDYLQNLFYFNATRQQIEDLVATYPDSAADGSPFRTGDQYNWYPQYKRLAALLGDLSFTLIRRLFLNLASQVNPDVPFWSYLSSYAHDTAILGTFHGSDVLWLFSGILPNYASKSIYSYYLSFVYDQDPNSRADTDMEWPQWSTNHSLMNFFNDHGALLADNFRENTYESIAANIQSLRF